MSQGKAKTFSDDVEEIHITLRRRAGSSSKMRVIVEDQAEFLEDIEIVRASDVAEQQQSGHPGIPMTNRRFSKV